VQSVLDIVIFLARHMILAFFLFWGLSWLGMVMLRNRTGSPALASLRFASSSASVLVLVAFAAVSVWYVLQQGFADEVEPVVSSLSWQVKSGQALYTSFDQAERYSVLYGPSVFLTNGFFLQILGPSLISAKIASALAALGSLVFLYAALARKQRDALALAVTAGAALFYWAQGFSVYLVRPDALVVFAVGLGFYAATRTSPRLAVIAVAVLAGFTVNLKIHCLVYFFPVVVVLAQRLGWKQAFWAMVGAGVVAVAPFVLYPQISAVNYVRWLANETGHGLRPELLGEPLRFIAFLGLPLAVLAMLRGKGHGYLGKDRGLVLSIVPGALCGIVLSAKPGSGLVHLLPLVPSTMFAMGLLARSVLAGDITPWRPALTRSAAAAVVLTALLTGSVTEYRTARMIQAQLAQIPGLVNDVEQIMERYEGLPMAMAMGGEERWYRCTWLQPLLTFRDNPVLVDPISVMDTVKSGRTLARATYNALTEGRVALWLVPRSQVPFQKMSWYDPHIPIFPQDFIQEFQNCYSLRGQSRYFDLWFWNGLDPMPGEALVLKTLPVAENPGR